jgi:hypothetical protein
MADKSPPGTASATSPSALLSTHPGQSPSGTSEKILAPHFRQILITLIIETPIPRIHTK